MASDETSGNSRVGYIFDCESEPIPPGTKQRYHLSHDGEAVSERKWWLIGAIAIAALVVGIVIGRLL